MRGADRTQSRKGTEGQEHDDQSRTREGTTRGEIELPALGIALVLLTAVLVAGIGTAQFALDSAERPALERHTAVSLSETFVGVAGPTHGENVLDMSRVSSLNATMLSVRYGLPEGSNVIIRLGDDVIVSTGDASDGTRIERIVLVAGHTERTIVPSFEETNSVTLPRRTANATVEIDPPANATVRTVWSNDRVVLRNDSGLAGTFEVAVSEMETTEFRFDAIGPLSRGSIRVDYYPRTTRKEPLAVIVDA
jgi:hypothetical protein